MTRGVPALVSARARHDPALVGEVIARRALTLDDGLALPHVRAASGACLTASARYGARLAVPMDDALFLALVDTGAEAPTALLALGTGKDGATVFEDARGNKRDKLDHECCAVVHDDDGAGLYLFGSGSKKKRTGALRVSLDDGAVRARDGRALHDAIARALGLVPDEKPRPNLEGVAADVDRALLFLRGNAGRPNGLLSLSTAALVAAFDDDGDGGAPFARAAVVDLGALDGVALGFTDGTMLDRERALFVAAAELSTDGVDDGRVTGSTLGVVDGDGSLRTGTIFDEGGRPLAQKLEGVARGDDDRVFVVVDPDDGALPAELLTLRVRGL